MSLDDVPIPAVIGNYYLQDKLGAGFSGAIYRSTHVYTSQEVAIKIQHVDDECPTNRYERGFYPSLQGGKGMPKIWGGGQQGQLDYIVMDLLGPSLDNLYRKNGKKPFDVRSVCTVAIQMIDRLQFMHARGILHRDIQLGNAVIGLPPNNQVIYMIDFGFSKRYIDPHTSRHIADNRKPRDFIGNYWFSSVNVHCNGRVPSRRDDMEAAALMFIHMLTPGGLPWTRNGVPKKDGEHDRLKKEKKQAKPADLCAGLPSEFEDFLRSCRKLKFADCPDYDFWKDEFRNLMEEKGWGTDDDFVWPPPVSASAVRSAAPSKVRTAPLTEDNVEKVLHDLANLNLAARPILGDRMGNANTPPRQESAPKPSKLPIPSRPSLATTASETIDVLSTDSDAPRTQQDKIPEGSRLPKAVQLRRIVKDIGAAVDNLALAHAVDSFVRVLRDTSSRNLTKEGFAVLDAIYKQLADPSVFVAPLRRPTRGGSGVEEVRTPRYTKADQLWKLKRDVDQASTNTELAEVIRVFGKVTDASNGRTLTKDGFSLLEALAGRLKAIA